MIDHDLTGILENWCLHIAPFDPVSREIFGARNPGYMPCVLTGQVVIDFRGRWSPGSCMRSTAIADFNFQQGIVITVNSTYQLRGPGRFRWEYPPEDYALAVGQTIAEVTCLLDRLNANFGTLH